MLEEDIWVSKDGGVGPFGPRDIPYLRGEVGWFPKAYAERVRWDY